jgi:hypothetical protein
MWVFIAGVVVAIIGSFFYWYGGGTGDKAIIFKGGMKAIGKVVLWLGAALTAIGLLLLRSVDDLPRHVPELIRPFQ